ncbi:PAN domain protein [Dictyocaulus viviparus]|uniref:PAN domain protein n=1 Tax=Dictyocaulus viviparus TaxID=29172 RepID=A0A0D8Y6I0_DICVI|nr:PAN domain protein [Dictyocaulus viviparus]
MNTCLSSFNDKMLLLLLLLPYLSWTKMDCCFERIRNHTLIGTVITTLDDVTLLQCQHECLEMKEQRCRSLMYYAKKSRCYMNSEDKDTRDSSLFSVVDTVDYYHRKCYHTLNTKIKQSVTVKRDSAFDDNCYEIFEGKVLIGVVDQLIQNVNTIEQCKKRCQRSKEANDLICKSAMYYKKDKVLIGVVDQLIQNVNTIEQCKKRCQRSKEANDLICKSAMYYKKDKECIIASMSRIDIPDLFIDDDQAVYMENICLNNRTSSTKKIQGSGKTSSEYSTGPPNIMKKTCTLLDHMEIAKDISRTTVVPTPQMNRVQPVTQKTIINNVELSGYDSPSEPTAEDITTADITTTTIMSTVSTPTTTIDARV